MSYSRHEFTPGNLTPHGCLICGRVKDDSRHVEPEPPVTEPAPVESDSGDPPVDLLDLVAEAIWETEKGYRTDRTPDSYRPAAQAALRTLRVAADVLSR